MQGLTIIEILRHLSVGAVAFYLGGFLELYCMKSVLESLGAVGASLSAFALGALLYYVYRPTVMRYMLLPLKDCICRSRNSENYRIYLINHYGMKNRQDAEIFWHSIRDSDKSRLEGLRKEASGVHFLYLTSLLLFLGAIYAFVCLLQEGVVYALTWTWKD